MTRIRWAHPATPSIYQSFHPFIHPPLGHAVSASEYNPSCHNWNKNKIHINHNGSKKGLSYQLHLLITLHDLVLKICRQSEQQSSSRYSATKCRLAKRVISAAPQSADNQFKRGDLAGRRLLSDRLRRKQIVLWMVHG